MMVGSFEARVETFAGYGGHKETMMGWSYKVNWSRMARAGSGPASFCGRRAIKRQPRMRTKKDKERTTNENKVDLDIKTDKVPRNRRQPLMI